MGIRALATTTVEMMTVLLKEGRKRKWLAFASFEMRYGTGDMVIYDILEGI